LLVAAACRAARSQALTARGRWGIPLLLAVVALALRLALTGLANDVGIHAGPLASLLGEGDWFALGMAIAVSRAAAEAEPSKRTWIRVAGERPGACVALGLVVWLVAAETQPFDVFLASYGLITHLLLGAMAALLVLAAGGAPRPSRPGARARLLEAAAAQWLGRMSYGIYLWQLPMRQLAERVVPVGPTPLGLAQSAALLAITLASTIVVSMLSWHLVEAPVQRFARRRPVRAPGSPPPGVARLGA
jgi:peptidoglycan/LPS O-acetylase OafA/YrhL